MAQKVLAGYPAPPGHKMEVVAHIDGPNPYATGGNAVTAAQLGLKNIEWIGPSGSDNAGHVVVGRFTDNGVKTSVKLVWIVVGTGVEVANGVNLSARSVRLLVRGS